MRCQGARANSLLKTSYKALRRYRGCAWQDVTRKGSLPVAIRLASKAPLLSIHRLSSRATFSAIIIA
jgi:hypothetical protein